MNLARAQALLGEGVAAGVFPGAAAGVALADGSVRSWSAGKTRCDGRATAVSAATLFDLASLTKVIGPATVLARMFDAGTVTLGETLSEGLPELPWNAAWGKVTLEDVLSHRAGFAAWKNFGGTPVRKKAEILSEIAREPPAYPPRSGTLYSDLGFILLGEWLERRCNTGLEALVRREVLDPLSLRSTLYAPLAKGVPIERIAATEEIGWRGGVVHGRVHDDNAFVLGEVAGHAGLFGPVGDVLSFGREWLAALAGQSSFLSQRAARRFASRADQADPESRALGWDVPSGPDSAAGRSVSPEAIGHLGYAGTSIWIDPVRGAAAALLTNRVNPSAKNERIGEYRTRFHDAVWQGLAA